MLFLKSQVNILGLSFRTHSALLRAGFNAESRLCVFLDSRFRGNDKCGAGMTGGYVFLKKIKNVGCNYGANNKWMLIA